MFAVIILAAGKGTRMKSPLPKVMHKVAGLPLIQWVINASKAAGAKDVATIVSEEMLNNTSNNFLSDLSCIPIVQKQRLGTGHAVLQGKDNFYNYKGPIIALLGDVPLIQPQTIKDIANQLQNNDVVVAGIELENPTGYGRLLEKEGKLTKIIEEKDANIEEKLINKVNSGVIGVKNAKQLFDMLESLDDNNASNEFYLTDIIDIANKQGLTCKTTLADANELRGINTLQDLSKAEATAQNTLRQQHMANGVVCQSPDSVYFSHDTKIAAGTVLEPNIYFGEEVEIAEQCHIKAFSHIEGAKIGKNTSVGPFARLRAGTVLGEDVKIGNFVETKKAEFKTGAKASHLSYIGDATVGTNANIGAGCITCNYDGYNKYKTTIGDEAFIGSNSALVAPVSIGEGAIVGAGSTITKKVEPHNLALTREKQLNINNWAKRFKKSKS